jgi:hypothetical protein
LYDAIAVAMQQIDVKKVSWLLLKLRDVPFLTLSL